MSMNCFEAWIVLSKEQLTIFSFDSISIFKTISLCPINVLMNSYVFKSNNLIVLSFEQVANLLFGKYSIFRIIEVWALTVFKHSAVSIFQIFIEPNASPLIKISSDTFFIHAIELSWPTNVLIHLPDFSSHNLIVVSEDPLNTF